MISIGVDLYGPELKDSKADRLVTATMKAAMQCRSPFEFGTSPAVNVAFYVPGSLGSPDWDGIRDSTFSRKRQLLLVQVAVPSKLVNSPALKEYLLESLHEANALAFEVFRRKGLRFRLAEAESLVHGIKERLDSEFASAHIHSA
jgi:hypothetical protein